MSSGPSQSLGCLTMVAADSQSVSSGVVEPLPEQAQLQLEIKSNSLLVLPEKSSAAGVRKPRSREITSRYKAAITTGAVASAANSNGVAPSAAVPRRHPSPTLGRNANPGDAPLVKRASSAERRRPWPATSTVVDSKVALNASTDNVWSSKRPVGRASGSGSGLLWPSSQGQSASLQSDSAAALCNGHGWLIRRESFSREASSSRPQSPATVKDSRTQVHSVARDGRPQTPGRDTGGSQVVCKEARSQTPLSKEAVPQTPPVKESRPQTPVKDARPQNFPKDGRPQTPALDAGFSRREGASKDPVLARRGSPKRDIPRRESPQRDRGLVTETALRPTANGVLRKADTISGPVSRKTSPLRRPIADQSENARPLENSPSKPELQRWPGTSNAQPFGPAMSRSVDLDSARAASMLAQNQLGGGTSSRLVKSVVSRSFSRSINEGPAVAQGPPGVTRRVSIENRVKGRVAADSNGRLGGIPDGAQNVSAAGAHTGEDAALTRVRQVQQETELAGTDGSNTFCLGENGSDTDSVSSTGSAGASKSALRGTVVAARFWQHTISKGQRGLQGGGISISDPEPVATFVPGIKVAVRQSKALAVGSQTGTHATVIGGVTAFPSMSPARSTASALAVLKTPGSPSKPSSPSRSLPSPTRQRLPSAALPPNGNTLSRLSNTMCMLNAGVDGRKGKRSLSQQEEAQVLRVLHNRWLQWRFVNARAEASLNSQRITAEVR